jgi:hypothetical protein
LQQIIYSLESLPPLQSIEEQNEEEEEEAGIKQIQSEYNIPVPRQNHNDIRKQHELLTESRRRK